MRRLLILVWLTALPLSAQVLIDGAKLGPKLRDLSPLPGETHLNCEVFPMRPTLNYGFRFQSGYYVRIPMSQFPGEGHSWGVLIKVTPDGLKDSPSFLVNKILLPKVPKTNVHFEMGGGFLVGPGRYKVEWLLFDDQSRVCRKTWQVNAQLTRAESAVKLTIPKNAVTDYSLRGLPPANIQTDDAKAIRLTVFMHVAPISMRRTTLRSSDRMTLLGSLSTLLEHVPTKSVRLVAFSLDQQKEIFHSDRFARSSIDEVAKSIDQLELGLVDIKVLQNRRGPVELLSEMLEHELAAPDPSEVVLFLGPGTRYFEKLPPSAIEPIAGAQSRLLFFQLHPIFRAGAPPQESFPDSISQTISKLKGKTLHIRTPGDFAKAIRQLEARN